MQFQDQPLNPSPTNDKIAPTTPEAVDASFLDDPTFIATINNRVERLMIQSIAGGPIELRKVDAELGAKILTFYALRKHDIEIQDPARFQGKHDMLGSAVWEAVDPLYKDPAAIAGSLTLVDAISGKTNQTLLFTDRKLLDDRVFALTILNKDGFNWIYLSDRLKAEPDIAIFAINHSKSAFEFIAKSAVRPTITYEMATLAMQKDGSALDYVPKELIDDNLVTISVDNGGGARLPYAAKVLGEKVWDNYERTLKAIEQWLPVVNSAPASYLTDPKCREILLAAARNDVIRVSDFPEALQVDPEFVPVIVENLPKRPNLYGWLTNSAKNHPDIKSRYETMTTK